MRTEKDLLFDKEQHLWIDVENDTIIVGITNYAQDQLGEVLFVELPEENSYEKEEYIFCIESGKKEQELFAPFDIKIIETNEELDDSPELINEDPYKNWIFKAKINNKDDLESLVNAETYLADL